MPVPRESDLVERLDAVLPQTQCQRCGYAGCRPYAEALAAGQASVNACPPGGETTRRALAGLCGQALSPVTPVHEQEVARAAWVVEADCIGCTRCIDACPLDAIIGSAGAMHTVVEAWCSGCRLCLPVCPTDCIVLREPRGSDALISGAAARERYRQRNTRRADVSRVQAEDGYVDLSGALREELHETVLDAVRRRRQASGDAPAA